jgi:hypothetical protein
MDASVLLVKALGGGWRTAPLGRIDASAEDYASRTKSTRSRTLSDE